MHKQKNKINIKNLDFFLLRLELINLYFVYNYELLQLSI